MTSIPANNDGCDRDAHERHLAEREEASGERLRGHGLFAGSTPSEKMEALCREFPPLHHLVAEGSREWSADRVLAFACQTDDEASRLAALFALRVWNRDTDWNIIAHMEGEEGEPPLLAHGETLRPFDLFEAWRIWDACTRRAALAWLVSPFWP